MKLKHIINYGTYNLRNEDIQRIRVANLIGILAPFATAVYALLHLFVVHSIILALGDIVFLFFYFSYFLLLGKGYIKTAKTLILSIAMIQLLILPTLFFSKDGGHYFFFLIAGPLAFLIFDQKDYIHKITISLASILFFFTGQFFGHNFILFPVNISPLFYQFIFIIHIIVINILLLFILQFFNLQIVRKEKLLNILAKTDPLTGLLNRREFYEISRNELKLSKRHQHELSFLLFDIDNFKKINDNYGHDTGDRVLIKMTEAVRQTVRTTDTVARYGGEEFILTLPETGIDQAYIVAEKLRTRIETLKIPAPEGDTITFTISIGVAGCTSEITDIDEVIKRADNCLYLAKNEGRNKTVVYK